MFVATLCFIVKYKISAAWCWEANYGKTLLEASKKSSATVSFLPKLCTTPDRKLNDIKMIVSWNGGWDPYCTNYWNKIAPDLKGKSFL